MRNEGAVRYWNSIWCYWPIVWCYAMSGTSLAYGATRYTCHAYKQWLLGPVRWHKYRSCVYARLMCGTETAYVLWHLRESMCCRSSLKMCSTETAYVV
eukprot:1044878-Rhodomonas_salina.2